MKRVGLSWSSGKDCAWALHLLRRQPGVEVSALVTTFNTAADRVAMHAVRRELVRVQAARARLPLWELELPWPCSNDEYEKIMAGFCERAVAAGLTGIAFGDLFLEDVRAYRERQLQGTNLEPLFPLWKIPTDRLANEMLGAGVKARITCIDPSKLDRSFCGRDWDAGFLADLPTGIDPCGERGEFHSFVYDSPCFSRPIEVVAGEIVERDNFVFADLCPLRNPRLIRGD